MNMTYQKRAIYQMLFAFIVAGLFVIPGSASVFTEHQMKGEQPARGGSTIYVDDSNTAGPWDGTLEHPYQFIQDGIDYANGGDTISVFNGFYVENIVVSKSLEIIGEDKENTVISGDEFGTVVKIIAEGVTISGFTITKSGNNPNNAGILIHTPYNTIVNNNIVNNKYFGIYIIEGSNNIIYHNNIFSNAYQAFDAVAGSTWDGGYPTGGNCWSDYEGTDANEDGIGEIPYPTGNSSADRYPLMHPYGSVYNDDTREIFLTIQGAINDANTLDGHSIIVHEGTYYEHLFVSKSVSLSGFPNDDCVIDGRSTGDVLTISADNAQVEFFKIQHSGTDQQNAGVVVNGDGCSILKNVIYKNFQGVVLKQSTKNTQILDNKISDSGWSGIILNPGCTGTFILGNTIADNFYAGLGITDASNNFIYHNNFKTNRHQAYDDATNIWDNGSISGGNYWSDYTGSDENGDGYGDTPYAIPEGINTDEYPLMEPYIGGDTIPPAIKIQTPSNGVYFWGARLFSGLFKKSTLIYGPITIEVQATDVQTGIERVEFLIDDSVTPVFTATQTPYSWLWSTHYLFMRKHTIIVVAYDNAGNSNFDMLEVRKYL
jgi:parallel beta-helix repeat protein